MKKLLALVLALIAMPAEAKKCCKLTLKNIAATCYQESNGKITFSVEENTAPYKAVLKNETPGSSYAPQKIKGIPNKATREFKRLPAGTYSLSLRSTCCSQCLEDIVVPVSPEMLVTIVKIHPACFDEDNGRLSCSITAGTPPYKATLFNSDSEAVQTIKGIQPDSKKTFKNLKPDRYKLVVTDGAGCCKAISGIEIPEASEIITTIGTIVPAFPGISNGKIPFTVSGGVSPYGATLINSNGEPVQTISGIEEGVTSTFTQLPADTYRLEIIDSNGCDEVVPRIIVPSSPVIVKVVEPVTPTCFGENNGTIPFTITGGTEPYTANLVNSTGEIVQTFTGIQAGVTNTFMNLGPDTYSIQVADVNGNPASVSNIVVKEIPQLVVTVGIITTTQPGLATGTIPFTITGGSPLYIAQVINSSGVVVQTFENIQPNTTTTANNLSADSYTITVTDSKNCTESVPGLLVDSSVLVITVTTTPVCFGQNNGTMTFVLTGGTAPYAATLINSVGEIVQTTQGVPAGAPTTFTDLVADTYRLSIVDQNANQQTVRGIECKLSPEIIIEVGVVTPSLIDDSTGAIPFVITGGEEPFTAVLTNSTGEIIQTIEGIETGVPTYFKNLPTETYTITVTDKNTCTQLVANIVVPESPVFIEVVEPVTPTCLGENDGTIPFTVSGGFPPYTANLLNSSNQIVQTITNLQSGIEDTFRDLGVGTYHIEATDTRGNFGTIGNIVVRALPPITLRVGPVTPTQVGSATGTIGFIASSGNPPYVADLLNSSSEIVQTISDVQPNVLTTFRNLSADSYTVQVTDSKGCGASAPQVVVSPSVLTITIVAITPTCFGQFNGTMTFSVTGGTGTYNAVLLNSQSEVVQSIPNVPAGELLQLTNLAPDTYSLTLLDTAGNTGTATNLVCQESPALVIRLGATTAPQPGLADGAIGFTVIGGVPNYTVQLVSNGNVVQTLQNVEPDVTTTFTGLPAGTYSIAVIDANGCKQTLGAIRLLNSIATFIQRKYCSNGPISITA